MNRRNRKLGLGRRIQSGALILATLCFCQPAIYAQKVKGPGTSPGTAPTSGTVRPHPFEPTEELIYVAEFSRALLKKVDVAEFRFTARKQPDLQKVSITSPGGKKNNSSYLLKFNGDIASKGFFSKLFNLRFRQQIESIVEPFSFTIRKTTRLDEQGKRARASETVYKDHSLVWTERDPNDPARPVRRTESSFTGQVQDLLSAIYYLRTQPLEIGKSLELTISDSGYVYQIPVRVVEKERKKTVLGRVETLRLDPEVFGPERMMDGEGQFSIWLTNDSRRIPVSARIKMKFGTVDITLRKITRNAPTESLANANILK